jgi:thiamine-phosphate pyrophosphorylase
MSFGLCVVTDRRRLGLSCSELIQRIEWLATAGIDLVQIRERDLCDRDLMRLVRDAVASTRDSLARIVVNDRVDVAMAADAAGVHLRENSASIDRVRAIAPPQFLIGCSIHDIDRARALSACDYLLFGTVFPSSGKPAGHPIAGVQTLRQACAASRRPVLAIGGVDPSNAREAIRCGAAGVAAVESLLSVKSAPEAQDIVAAFRRAFAEARREG